MTAVEVSASALSEAEHGRQLRRAMVASTIGTIIEAYDFLLYGQVAGLVFAKLFFPGSDPLTGTLQAFGIYAVGFVAGRGRDLRPFRRPHRPQGHVDRDPAVDRLVDLCRRSRPRLCGDRHLGRPDP